MKKQQINKFIKIRNSSSFNSNLQFDADCDEVGFKQVELGEVFSFIDDEIGKIYFWRLPNEMGTLIEAYGKLHLYPENSTTANQLAVYIKAIEKFEEVNA